MTVFISYARANLSAAEKLRDDVERCHREVWLDQELTGGQSWWQGILQHIRECDVFIVALSSEWVQSTACDLELRYAIALARPVLPVMVARMDPRLAQRAIVDAQIVNYRERSPETTFALRDALDNLPSAPPLPTPLPAEPAPPISYLHDLIVMLNTPSLHPRQQHDLWQRLHAVLDEAEGDEHLELLKLVRKLRRRRDLVPALFAPIDAVLGGPPTPPPGPNPLLAPGPPPWRPPPAPPTVRIQPPPARSRRRGVVWVSAGLGALAVTAAVLVGVAIAKRGTTPGDVHPPTQTTVISTNLPTSAGVRPPTKPHPHPTTSTTTSKITTDSSPHPPSSTTVPR